MAGLARSVSTRESSGLVLSAVVLCYRAEENVHRVVGPLSEELRRAGISHEMVLVANYRPEENDRTPAVVRELAREREGISTLTLEKQGARGWDMRTGLSVAVGDHIVIIDGDAWIAYELLLGPGNTAPEAGYPVTDQERCDGGKLIQLRGGEAGPGGFIYRDERTPLGVGRGADLAPLRRARRP